MRAAPEASSATRPGWAAPRRVGPLVGALALVAALLVGRVLVGARSEYAHGKAAERAGQLDAALPAYRRAIGWYVPGSPYGARAIAALSAIGARAQQQGDAALALAAERAIAAGIASTRSFYEPHRAALAAAQQRIRALEARRPGASSAPAPPADPSPLLSVTALLGWLGFVACSLGLVLRASDPANGLRSLSRLAGGLLASATLFALSLWLA